MTFLQSLLARLRKADDAADDPFNIRLRQLLGRERPRAHHALFRNPPSHPEA